MNGKVEERGWEARVRFLGDRSDVKALMSSADILLHPSEREGFGLVLVEALALGVPIVTTNAEAIPEILKGSRSRMVDAGDVDSFQRAVAEILKSSESEAELISSSGAATSRIFPARETDERHD